MILNKLSVSYKCQSSIGNSLKLEEMIEEVLVTFLEETEAIFGSFYLIENNSTQFILSMGKKIDCKVDTLLEKSAKNEISIYKYNENLNLFFYRLEKGLLIFIYDENIDLHFIKAILESLRKRLDISVNSCLNVKNLEEKNLELKNLTIHLQDKVNEAVELNKRKDKQMFEQMKMAQMGELIGNIAHQWRQPLSIISTIASGMKLKKEMNILDDKDFFEYTNKIVDNTQLLSTTIDEFRDYIKESYKEKEILIQDRVQMAIKIIEPSFLMNNIRIIEDYMEKDLIYFKLISGELLQVLISILNNTKDAFNDNNIENKWMKYSVKKETNSFLIIIEDNAGGIPIDILDKIFNPYFTTKHQKQGTGIGLYNCYNIITKHLHGNIYAVNTDLGAKFTIELPYQIN
ncbi:HAMP domain-containing histidine kinase [bacterium]|jgi:signal transduction histidine kinase|nr:HAMP domain-containing histidine kinase [bacterium]